MKRQKHSARNLNSSLRIQITLSVLAYTQKINAQWDFRGRGMKRTIPRFFKICYLKFDKTLMYMTPHHKKPNL